MVQLKVQNSNKGIKIHGLKMSGKGLKVMDDDSFRKVTILPYPLPGNRLLPIMKNEMVGSGSMQALNKNLSNLYITKPKQKSIKLVL